MHVPCVCEVADALQARRRALDQRARSGAWAKPTSCAAASCASCSARKASATTTAASAELEGVTSCASAEPNGHSAAGSRAHAFAFALAQRVGSESFARPRGLARSDRATHRNRRVVASFWNEPRSPDRVPDSRSIGWVDGDCARPRRACSHASVGRVDLASVASNARP